MKFDGTDSNAGGKMAKIATLKELADLIGGQLDGDPGLEVIGLSSLEEAGPKEMTFLANPKDLPRLAMSKAAAAVVPSSIPSFPKPVIRTANPHLAYARIQTFFTQTPYSPKGVDPRAFLGRDVRLGKDVSIHPMAYVGDRSEIGDRVVIHPGVYVGEGVQIGEESVLYPNVVVMNRCIIGKRVILHPGVVIGSDGFGFARDGAKSVKIPQVGIVQIDDDVEIGANCAVDRAAIGKTWIQRGVKMDNLIQIGHNVTIGEDTVIVAQVGIAGSAQIGNRVALGGQVGIAGHLKIGDGAMIAAQAGVPHDVPPGAVMSGTPAIPHRESLRAVNVFPKLPEMKRTLGELEKRVQAIEEKVKSEK